MTAVQCRTRSGNQYNTISQMDDPDEIQTIEQPLAIASRRSRAEETLPSRRSAIQASLLVPQVEEAPPSSSGIRSSNKRDEYEGVVTLKWQHWESKIIFAGAFLGMLAYASQWAFWDGFVKTAGDRFCPPSIFKIGAWWFGAAILCKCMGIFLLEDTLTCSQLLLLHS